MLTRKKVIKNGVFLLTVFLLTMFGVFRGEDLQQMFEAIKGADIRWLFLGISLVVCFIWGESFIIWYMLRSFRIDLKKRICFLFSSVGFFFSCITPSASGGQPMQLYYMNKEKIPVPVSAVILMIVTITYKLVLVVTGLGVLVFGREFTNCYLKGILPVYYLGLVLNIVCVGFMTVLVFHPCLAESILMMGEGCLKRLHLFQQIKMRRKKLQESMQTYRETAQYLKQHKKVLIVVIICTFLQRFALFAVTWMVYRSFGLSGMCMEDVVLLQAVIAVSVDMLPLPGGMGVSETLFLKIFAPVFGTLLLPAMVLSRSLGYYSELMISAVFTAAAQIYYSIMRGGKISKKSGKEITNDRIL
ncbi:MAG: flippase-like domain-containing protein [Dorea sp.]|nr:flippase-like domain-containing protein [Dorea sp.]